MHLNSERLQTFQRLKFDFVDPLDRNARFENDFLVSEYGIAVPPIAHRENVFLVVTQKRRIFHTRCDFTQIHFSFTNL